MVSDKGGIIVFHHCERCFVLGTVLMMPISSSISIALPLYCVVLSANELVCGVRTWRRRRCKRRAKASVWKEASR